MAQSHLALFDNNTSLCMYGSATSRTNEVGWRDSLHMVLPDIWVWIDGILYVERQSLSYRIYKKATLKNNDTLHRRFCSLYCLENDSRACRPYGLFCLSEFRQLATILMVCICDNGGYLLFYLTFKYLPTRIALCAFISISIGYIVVLNLLDVSRYWYGGTLGIAIGIMWRWYEGEIRRLLRSNTISIILFCSAVALWVVFSKYIQFKEFHPLFTSTMLIVLIHRAPFPKNGSLVRFLSRISFELYLFQALAMRIVFDYLGFSPSWYAMALLLLTDIVISAIFLYGLIQPILTKLTK